MTMFLSCSALTHPKGERIVRRLLEMLAIIRAAMKFRPVLLAALAVAILCGCTNTPRKDAQLQRTLARAFTEPFAPLYDVSMLRSGAVDLLYCSASFRHKRGRWPVDFSELSEFAKESDGYLMLGEYERVLLKPLPADEMEVCYVRARQTNEMKFTIENAFEKK